MKYIELETKVTNTRIVLLLAAERSGTHLFRSILTRNKTAFAPGEVANAAAIADATSETNFFLYRRDFLQNEAKNYIPSQEVTKNLCDGYFAKFGSVAASRGHKAAVCDIKYGHIVNFCGGWWDMISPPFLLDWARRNQIHIVHLVRRRITETCLSNLYAHHTGVWRTRNPADLKASPLRIDRARLEKDISRIRRVIGLFQEWTRPCSTQEIYYEDLLLSDSPSWKKIRNLFEHPIKIIESDFLKTTPPHEEIIENYSDIEDLVRENIIK